MSLEGVNIVQFIKNTLNMGWGHSSMADCSSSMFNLPGLGQIGIGMADLSTSLEDPGRNT